MEDLTFEERKELGFFNDDVEDPSDLPSFDELYQQATEKHGDAYADHMIAGGFFDGGYREYYEDDPDSDPLDQGVSESEGYADSDDDYSDVPFD